MRTYYNSSSFERGRGENSHLVDIFSSPISRVDMSKYRIRPMVGQRRGINSSRVTCRRARANLRVNRISTTCRAQGKGRNGSQGKNSSRSREGGVPKEATITTRRHIVVKVATNGTNCGRRCSRVRRCNRRGVGSIRFVFLDTGMLGVTRVTWIYARCGAGWLVGRRCPSVLLRGTMKRFTGLPNIKHGATVQLMLRLLERSATIMRTFNGTVVALGRRIGCYGIYRGVSSARAYHVYSGPTQSTSAVYIIRDVHSIVTIRTARRCEKLCRILKKIVSPVSNVNPSSLRVRDLIRQIGNNRIGRIVLTLDSAVRKSAAGFCVSHGLSNVSIGLDIVTHNVSVKSRLRCASRIALKHSVVGHALFAKATWAKGGEGE